MLFSTEKYKQYFNAVTYLFLDSIVRCSNLNYDVIPVDQIPEDTTELYFERNGLKEIPLEINRLSKLRRMLV